MFFSKIIFSCPYKPINDLFKLNSICSIPTCKCSIFTYKCSINVPCLCVITACFCHYDIFCQHLTGTKPQQILLINDSFPSKTWAIF